MFYALFFTVHSEIYEFFIPPLYLVVNNILEYMEVHAQFLFIN